MDNEELKIISYYNVLVSTLDSSRQIGFHIYEEYQI